MECLSPLRHTTSVVERVDVLFAESVFLLHPFSLRGPHWVMKHVSWIQTTQVQDI